MNIINYRNIRNWEVNMECNKPENIVEAKADVNTQGDCVRGDRGR